MAHKNSEKNPELRRTEALERIAKATECICQELFDLRWLLYSFFFPLPRALQILQITGDTSMSILGIAVGGVGVFQVSPSAPPNAVEPTGTTRVWTTSDTANTALTPSADGTTVSVAVGASAPVGGSFTLSVVDTYPDGTSASGSATVPYLAAAAPPEPTALQINQLS